MQNHGSGISSLSLGDVYDAPQQHDTAQLQYLPIWGLKQLQKNCNHQSHAVNILYWGHAQCHSVDQPMPCSAVPGAAKGRGAMLCCAAMMCHAVGSTKNCAVCTLSVQMWHGPFAAHHAT